MTVYKTSSTEETIDLGKKFAASLVPGDIVALSGNIGTGKTHFIKGVAQGFGYKIDVTSPTFNILHEYSTSEIVLYHFDFYRLENANELKNIGFYEYLYGGGISLLEWSDKVVEFLPDNIWQIHIQTLDENIRVINITGSGLDEE